MWKVWRFVKLKKEEDIVGKIKLLLNVIEDMRCLASSLEEVAKAFCECEGENDEEKLDRSFGKGDERKSDNLGSEISLEEVRAFLAKKSREGFTDKIREIIKSYNCNKLSEIKPEYYEEVMKRAEEFSDDER